MATRSERILYIGTAEGLFQAEWDGAAYRARLMGLQGCGALRSPVVVDHKESRRIYAATSRGGVFRSEDRGESWHEINHGIVYKEAWSLAQHPLTGRASSRHRPNGDFQKQRQRRSMDGVRTTENPSRN